MSYGDSDVPMVSNDCNIDAFLRAIEEKDLLEIISFADKEAMAAWRLSYRKNKCGEAHTDLPNRYEHTLEELISFLRTALVCRPSKMDDALFEQFLELRRKVIDEKGLRRNLIQDRGVAVGQ